VSVNMLKSKVPSSFSIRAISEDHLGPSMRAVGRAECVHLLSLHAEECGCIHFGPRRGEFQCPEQICRLN
jgi:hypothetical protein